MEDEAPPAWPEGAFDQLEEMEIAEMESDDDGVEMEEEDDDEDEDEEWRRRRRRGRRSPRPWEPSTERPRQLFPKKRSNPSACKTALRDISLAGQRADFRNAIHCSSCSCV